MVYDIEHITEYRFHRPVELGLHRLTFRPRDGHDMRVLATELVITPTEQRVDHLAAATEKTRAADDRGGHGEAQPRFADAARSGERNEPRASQGIYNRLNLWQASD